MTQEGFIEQLHEKGYSYEIEGDKIIVTHEGNVDLELLTSLPPGVVFKNGGNVSLSSLTSLPPGVEFRNEGNVYLRNGVEFIDGGNVYLRNLTSLPPGVKFENGDVVFLESLIGREFDGWKGNIEGIDSNRLLNSMIKQGIFER